MSTSRQVKYAVTHASIFAGRTIGELGSTFPPQNKILKDLKMHINEIGLTISFVNAGSVVELLVPSANVKFMDLVAEEKPVKAVKAVA